MSVLLTVLLVLSLAWLTYRATTGTMFGPIRKEKR